MKKVHLLPALILSLIVLLTGNLYSQGFDLNLYQQFLQNHQNMQTQDLLDMHPAGIFEDNLNLNYQDVFYLDSIDAKYNLTEYEKSLIQNHGFMVTQRLSQKSFGEILLDIHHNDLPVFVSTDAILYAYHVSYDRILREVELGYLIDKVSTLLGSLRNSFPQIVSNYSSEPEMLQMLKDVDLYLTVGAKLIGQNISPYYPENTVIIDTVISRVMDANSFYNDTLFSSNCVAHDYSQFKPRGHYDSDEYPELRQYFRAMMWLGRIELYLIKPSIPSPDCWPQTKADIQRQIIDANLVYELFGLANVFSDYEEIEDVIKFFVGEQDNVTLDNMDFLRKCCSADQVHPSFLIHLKYRNSRILSGTNRLHTS